MNVRTLITRAQQQAGRVDTGFDSRTLRALNDAQEKWAVAMPWPTLVKHETFNSDGSQQLILPPRVKRIVWLADKTNKRSIEASGQWDRMFTASFLDETQDAAKLWRELGFTSVTSQPSSASFLSVLTTATDTFNVYISGFALDTTASGTALEKFAVSEVLTITGPTGYTSVNQYVEVVAFSKDDLTPADLSLRLGSSVIARIPKDQYRSPMRRVELLFRPLSGTQIECEYIAAPAPLSTDPQVPDPAIDDRYLVWYAAGIIHRMQNQADLAGEAFIRAKEILDERIYHERAHGDADWQGVPDPNYWGVEDNYVQF